MDIPILFGRFLVRKGKISNEALNEAIKVQSEINRSFAAVAVEHGFISFDDFKKALGHQRENGLRFRDSLAELKIADEETLLKIDSSFKETTIKLGELLVKRGALVRDDLEEALKDFRENNTMELI